MEIVAEMPDTRVEGFLAAGHAATITGSAIFERFVERHGLPVVVAGFEPLDILAGLVRLVELVRDKRPAVVNMFPRCVTAEGNLRAQEQLWRVFAPSGGRWRGIAFVPSGNLRLREEWAHLDARRRFRIDLSELWAQAPPLLAGPVHLRRHHVRHLVARRLPALRRRMRAGHARRCVHGEQRGHVPHLASVRTPDTARRVRGGVGRRGAEIGRRREVTTVTSARIAIKHGAGAARCDG
jgi:hypothetical protein